MQLNALSLAALLAVCAATQIGQRLLCASGVHDAAATRQKSRLNPPSPPPTAPSRLKPTSRRLSERDTACRSLCTQHCSGTFASAAEMTQCMADVGGAECSFMPLAVHTTATTTCLSRPVDAEASVSNEWFLFVNALTDVASFHDVHSLNLTLAGTNSAFSDDIVLVGQSRDHEVGASTCKFIAEKALVRKRAAGRAMKVEPGQYESSPAVLRLSGRHLRQLSNATMEAYAGLQIWVRGGVVSVDEETAAEPVHMFTDTSFYTLIESPRVLIQ